jgi:hypothetical protein
VQLLENLTSPSPYCMPNRHRTHSVGSNLNSRLTTAMKRAVSWYPYRSVSILDGTDDTGPVSCWPPVIASRLSCSRIVGKVMPTRVSRRVNP